MPLGNWIARIFTDKNHWRVERGIYKLTGIDPDADMRWTVYVRSILAFSAVAVLFVYLIERTQHWLFWAVGMSNVPTDMGVEHRGVVRHEHQLAELRLVLQAVNVNLFLGGWYHLQLLKLFCYERRRVPGSVGRTATSRIRQDPPARSSAVAYS